MQKRVNHAVVVFSSSALVHGTMFYSTYPLLFGNSTKNGKRGCIHLTEQYTDRPATWTNHMILFCLWKTACSPRSHPPLENPSASPVIYFSSDSFSLSGRRQEKLFSFRLSLQLRLRCDEDARKAKKENKQKSSCQSRKTHKKGEMMRHLS